MSLPAVCILALVLCIFVWGLKFGGRLPSGFRDRACQGRDWRRAFPRAPKPRIRTFLQVFVDAFAFDANEKLKFSPEDRILDVYRAVYPSRWTPDSLEVETFACELEKRFGLRLECLSSDQLTLGDVFSAIEAKSA
jgi:propanediol dehydratase small subunit